MITVICCSRFARKSSTNISRVVYLLVKSKHHLFENDCNLSFITLINVSARRYVLPLSKPYCLSLMFGQQADVSIPRRKIERTRAAGSYKWSFNRSETKGWWHIIHVYMTPYYFPNGKFGLVTFSEFTTGTCTVLKFYGAYSIHRRLPNYMETIRTTSFYAKGDSPKSTS